MKSLTTIPLIILISLVTGCCSKECVDVKLSDDFLNDLASEDNRLASDLYLEDFNGNLDTLTYDYYISYLKKNEAPSAEDLAENIQCADEKYLLGEPGYFVLVLLYKDKRTIIGDDSRTQVSVDTIYIYTQQGSIPSLSTIAEQLKR